MTAITTAARLLREAAAELKNAHTLGGDWGNELEALDAYNEHMATATTLEHMARQCLAQIEEPAQPVAEICSASHDDAQFGERAIKPLRDISGFEYGTPLYAGAAPAAMAPRVRDLLGIVRTAQAEARRLINGEDSGSDLAQTKLDLPETLRVLEHALSQPAAVAGPANDLEELAMLNKLIELGAKASYAHAKSNSDDGPAGTAAYVQWQELRAEMGELIRAHVAPALEAPAAPTAPDGWKLVPVEPTREMLDCYVREGGRFHSARADWAAMLAAAPQAPAAPVAGNWIAADDVDRLVRELDVALSGEADAAPQASLCDIVALVKKAARDLRRPVLAAPAASADERAAYVAFLAGKFPQTYSKEDAEHWWDHGHVSALTWQAARAVAAAPAAPAVDADPQGLRDVGEALMETIERNADALKAVGWLGPMDCPSEIVVDLLNLLDEANTTSALGEWVATLEVDSGGGLDYETVPPCTLPPGCYPLYRAAQAKEGGAA